MKPLISYYGGKQRIATQIVKVLNKIPHTVYAEPFAGGLAVLFAKPLPVVGNGHHYRESINDSSELLINLYRVAQWQPEEFQRIIEWTLFSKSEYSKAIQICKNPSEYSDIEKAWAYYVNIQQSFSNKLDAGWGVRLHSRNGASTWQSKKERLLECLERLKEVHIDCRDALDFIDAWDSPQTLFYCDPPYPGTNLGHYDGYTMDDWQALCEKLDSCESSYVLSNYPQEIEPKSAQQRIEIQTVMSASGKGKVGKATRSTAATQEELGERTRTEVLWVCDRSSRMRSDLDSALRSIDIALTINQMSLFA